MVNANKHKQMKDKALRLKGRNSNGTFKQQYELKRDTQLKITVSAETKNKIKHYANTEGKSITNYILQAILFYENNK